MPSSNYLINAAWLFFLSSIVVAVLEMMDVSFFSVAGINITLLVPFLLAGMYAFAAHPDEETEEVISTSGRKEKEEKAEKEFHKKSFKTFKKDSTAEEASDAVTTEDILPKATHLPYAEQVYRQNQQFTAEAVAVGAGVAGAAAVNAMLTKDNVWWKNDQTVTPPQSHGEVPPEAEENWSEEPAPQPAPKETHEEESYTDDSSAEDDWAASDTIEPPDNFSSNDDMIF